MRQASHFLSIISAGVLAASLAACSTPGPAPSAPVSAYPATSTATPAYTE